MANPIAPTLPREADYGYTFKEPQDEPDGHLIGLQDDFVRVREIREIIRLRLIKMKRSELKSLRDLDKRDRSDTLSLLGRIPSSGPFIDLKQTLAENIYSEFDSSVPFWRGFDLNGGGWQAFVIDLMWRPSG